MWVAIGTKSCGPRP